jgi:hypothetical protein
VAVTLKKSVSPETNPGRSEAPFLQKEAGREHTLENLKKRILDLSFQSKYCDIQTFQSLIRFAIDDCGLDEFNASATIEFELEQNCILHEGKKIEELYSLLQRFTKNDKKLDEKERADALQIVSRKKPGYLKALNPEVATSHVIKFCRDNEVKIKTGLFKWEIP